MVGDQDGAGGSAPGACPLCGRPLYGWVAPTRAGCSIAARTAASWSSGELPSTSPTSGARSATVRRRRFANRGSLQATIGLDGWAALELCPGNLVLTRRSLELLARRNGAEIESAATPATRRAQAWMWQTLLNGLTFHPNFAREWRAGRLRPSSAASRSRFYADLVVTVLAAPLIALVSAPLELGAALAGRAGSCGPCCCGPSDRPLYDRSMEGSDPFGGMFGDPDELRARLSEMAEQMQGAQRVAWADNAIKLAVDMTVAAINRLDLSGASDEQAIQVRDAIRIVFPEAVTLVREAREGLS